MAVRYEGQIPRVNAVAGAAPPRVNAVAGAPPPPVADPAAPGPVRGAAPPPIQEPAGPVSLEESMRKRMAAVQAGQADPGNADFYGYNQLTGGPAAPAAAGAPGGAPGGAGAPITTAGGVTGTTATVGGSAAQGAPTTVAQSFQQALINRLNPEAVNAQNSQVAPAIQANKLAEQRGFERQRNILAERAAKSGTDASGGFDTALLGLDQDRSMREGQFAGNAVMDLGRQQQQDITSALAMGGNMLSEQDRMALQSRLADLDAQLRREGIGAQTSLGNRDLDLRGRLGEGQLNLGLLQALMSNDQFGRSLGQNASQFGASLDQNGLLGILGML